MGANFSGNRSSGSRFPHVSASDSRRERGLDSGRLSFCQQQRVHAPQAIGHRLHDLDCKERRVLNQIQEALLRDRRDPRMDGGHGRRRALFMLDKRELAEHPAGADPLYDTVTEADFDLAFDHDIHDVARVAYLNDVLADGDLVDIRSKPEHVDCRHSVRIVEKGEVLLGNATPQMVGLERKAPRAARGFSLIVETVTVP